MNVLLDTHICLWAMQDSVRLTPAARTCIGQATRVYVSAASIWEVSVKAALGKLRADPLQIAASIQVSGFHELPVYSSHAARVATLPMHHRDPFDRLLIAQAMTEPLVLLTADKVLEQYTDLVRVV